MAWNTEETRRRIKQAATEEFAEHGLPGTTMERIAKRAGANKERLYHYYGSKERLFATVLSAELAKLAAAVPLDSIGEGDVGEYAGRVFDYHAANPHLTRLLLFEGLAYGNREVPEEAQRAVWYRAKAEAFAAAQREGVIAEQPEAADFVLFIIALAAWWHAVPQIARMLTGSDGQSRAEFARRRVAVVHAARQLARGSLAQP
ncbi:MAG: TetR family transcriptional regulator [Candidatus Dormibacteria bacterium]